MVPHWSDDPSLWEAMAPALSAPERFAIAERDVAAIVGAVPLAAGASVLDAGCGAGVHCAAFSRRGFAVTGVDRSEALLRIARLKAPGVEFVNADLRDLPRSASYDLVCSLYASFGYYEDDVNERVLRNLEQSLRAGGTFVLDVIGRESLARHWQPEARTELAGTVYDVHRSVADDGSSMTELWTVGDRQFKTVQRIYGAREIDAMLREAGFGRVALWGAFDGRTPYTPEAPRLIAFASR